MVDSDALAALLARLTPAWLWQTVHALATAEPSARESGVALPAILNALAGGVSLGEGAAGWSARLRLTKAISDAAAATPGLLFVQGDA